MSELSYFLVERVLHNSVNVMKRQREELGIKEYPLYTHDEVDDLSPRFEGFSITGKSIGRRFTRRARGFCRRRSSFTMRATRWVRPA